MMTGHNLAGAARPYAVALTAGWVLLFPLGALFLFAAVSDLAAFAQVTGTPGSARSKPRRV